MDRNLIDRFRFRKLAEVYKQFEIFIAYLFQHKGTNRLYPFRPGLLVRNLFREERLQGLAIDGLSHRSHHKDRDEQGEADENLIGRHLWRPHRLAEEREDNHDSREGRDHDEKCRRQGKHRQERDYLEDDGGLFGTRLAKIDRDRRIGLADGILCHAKKQADQRHEQKTGCVARMSRGRLRLWTDARISRHGHLWSLSAY